MKHLLFLIFTYAYLETPRSIGSYALENVPDLTSASLQGTESEDHLNVAKRASPYKRLPAWSFSYGKRSDNTQSDIENLYNIDGSQLTDSGNGEYNGESAIVGDLSKRPSFKRLHSWMTTYGKRSMDDTLHADSLDFGDESDNLDLDESMQTTSPPTDNYMEEADKRAPGWYSSYGKRLPGWSTSYGKRAPGWYTSYGKRAPGWYSAYGKRAAGWYSAYGKRAPGWYSAYGKRAPGWYTTYGKRTPGWYTSYGKRAPGWYATYGKRAPGWYTSYGKRASGWPEAYDKRLPGWGASYGKRSSDLNTFSENLDTIREQLTNNNNVKTEEKRLQAWHSAYGR